MNNVSPVTVVIPANVETPETLNCLVNNVSPVTVVIPANVESPSTFNAPPTFNLLPIPTPPGTTSAPVVVLRESVSSLIF